MPQNEGPKIQGESPGLKDQIAAENQQATAATSANPSEDRTHDQIAENHERLQNAGFEEINHSPQSTVSTTSSSPSSSVTARRDNQAFEDQRTSASQTSQGGKRSRRERRYIPDSIRAMVDLLKNSLSEEQVAEILEKAIEDRAEGSALQISQSELKEAAKEIFQHIKEVLANGDLHEVDAEAIEKRLGRVFVDHDLELEEDELRYFSDLIRENAPEAEREQFAASLDSKSFGREFVALAEAIDSTLNVIPELRENPKELASRVVELLNEKSNWLAHAEEEGVDNFVRQLQLLLEEKSSTLVTSGEAESVARAIFLREIEIELTPSVSEIARNEIVAAIEGKEIPNRDAEIENLSSLTKKFPELATYLHDGIELERKELSNYLESRVGPFLAVSERLIELGKDGKESEREILEILLQLDPRSLQEIQRFVGGDYGETLEKVLQPVFGARAEAIITGVLERDSSTLEALQARILGLEVVHPRNLPNEDPQIAEEERSQQEERFVGFVEESGREAANLYQELFGGFEEVLGREGHHRTSPFVARLNAFRDEDDVLQYALRLEELQLSQEEGDYGANLTKVAEFVSTIPRELRQAVVERAEKEFGNTTVAELLKAPSEDEWQKLNARGERAYLQGIIHGSELEQVAATLYITEQSQYHSFTDLLRIYNGHRNQFSNIQELKEVYERLFDRPLELSALQQTQLDTGEGETQVSRAIQDARRALYQNIIAGEDLQANALRVIIAHEAQTLGEQVAIAETGRRSANTYDVERFSAELEDLKKIGEELGGDDGVAPVIARIAYTEAREESRIRNLSTEVYRLGREHCKKIEMDNSGAYTKEKLRREMLEYLDRNNVQDEELRKALISHWDTGYKKIEETFTRMRNVAEDLYESVDGWNDSDKLVRIVTGGKFRSKAAFMRSPDYAHAFNATECGILDFCFKEVSGESFHQRLIEEYNTSVTGLFSSELNGFGKAIAHELNGYYAPEDKEADRALDDIGKYFTRTEGLLDRLKEADDVSLSAIELRQAIQSEDAVSKIVEILSKENGYQILAQHEELYGVDILEELKTDLSVSTIAVIPGDPGRGIERQIVNEQTILTKIVARVKELGPEGGVPITDEIGFELLHYSRERLLHFAEEEAKVEAGFLREGTLKGGCFVQYDVSRLEELQAKRENYMAFLQRGFQEEDFKALQEEFVQQSEQAYVQATLSNYKILKYYESLGVHLSNPGVAKQNESALNAFMNHHAELFHMDSATRPELTSRNLNHLRGNIDEWIKSTDEEISSHARQIYRTSWKSAHDLHESMKGGWNYLFGTDEDKIHETLRDLSPEERMMTIQLYELRYGVRLSTHFNEEMEGRDASRAFAHLRGDHLYAEQVAVVQALDYWWGTEDAVRQSSERTSEKIVIQAREILEQQADELEELALQKEMSGEVEEARRIRIEAYHVREGASAELSEGNAFLADVIQKLNEGYWDGFDSRYRDSGVTELSLRYVELDDPDNTLVSFEEGIDPDGAWLAQFSHALENDSKAAARLLQDEQRKLENDLLNLQIEIGEDGLVKGEVRNGNLLIDGEEISGDVVKSFYVQQLIEQQLNLAKAGRGEEAQTLGGMIEQIQQTDFKVWAEKAFQLEAGSPSERGDATRRILSVLLVNGETGAPSASQVDKFEKFISRSFLVPKYREAIVEGTLLTGDKHPEAVTRWNERIATLNSEVAKEQGDGVTLKSLIQSELSGDEEKWLLAELSGDLHTAAAYQVRKDILGDGENDTLAVAALLPERLVAFQDQLTAEIAQLERVLESDKDERIISREHLAVLKELAATRNEIAERNALLSQAVGKRSEELQSELEGLKTREAELNRNLPSERNQIVSRYLTICEERDDLRLAIKQRGDAIEKIYNEKWGVRLQYASIGGSGDSRVIGMWDHLSQDLGAVEAKTYRTAVQNGELTDAMRLAIGCGGHLDGTDEDLVFRSLGSSQHGGLPKSKEELLDMAEEFCNIKGYSYSSREEAFQQMKSRALQEVGGDDQWRAEVLFIGKPDSVADMAKILKLHNDHARGAALQVITDQFGTSDDEFDKAYNQFFAIYDPKKKEADYTSAEMQKLRALFNVSDTTAEQVVNQREVVGSMIVEGGSVVVVVGGSILLAIPSGGTSIVAGLSATSIILGTGAAAMTVRVGGGLLLKGGSYDGGQLATDTALVAVDVVSLGAGEMISQGVRRAGGYVVGRWVLGKAGREAAESTATVLLREGVEEAGEQTAKAFARAGVEEAGEQTAKALLREGVAQVGTKSVSRQLAGGGIEAGIAEAERRFWARIPMTLADGMAQGALDGGMSQGLLTGIDADTWKEGFLTGIYRTGQASFHGAAFGAGIGGAAGVGLSEFVMRPTAYAAQWTPIIKRTWIGEMGRSITGSHVARSVDLSDGAPTTRFVSEEALRTTTEALETAKREATVAKKMLEDASLGKIEITPKQRRDYEIILRSEARVSKAQGAATVDAELSRNLSMDGDAMESVMRFRDSKAALREARLERRARLRQGVTELFRPEIGHRRFREALAATGEAFSMNRTIGDLKRTAQELGREVKIRGQFCRQVAASNDPASNELRRLAEKEVRSRSNFRQALKSLDFKTAAQEFRVMQGAGKGFMEQNVEAGVKQALKMKGQELKDLAARLGVDSFDDTASTIADDLQTQILIAHEKALRRESKRATAWNNLTHLRKFEPSDLLLSKRSIRQGMREVEDLNRALLSTEKLNSRLVHDLSLAERSQHLQGRVRDFHVSRFETEIAKQNRWSAAKRSLGDLVKLRPVSAAQNVGNVIGETFQGLRAWRRGVELEKFVDEAVLYHRYLGDLNPRVYGARARAAAQAAAETRNQLRVFTRPLESSMMFVEDIGLNSYRLGRKLVGLSSDPLIFRRNPVTFLLGSVDARSLTSFRYVAPSWLRQVSQSRKLMRFNREHLLKKLFDASIDGSISRIHSKLGLDERFTQVAENLARMNADRQFAWTRFKYSFLNARDSLVAGDFSKVGTLMSDLKDAYGVFRHSHANRASAFDDYLIAKRQLHLESTGLEANKANRIARMEVRGRRAAIDGLKERDFSAFFGANQRANQYASAAAESRHLAKREIRLRGRVQGAEDAEQLVQNVLESERKVQRLERSAFQEAATPAERAARESDMASALAERSQAMDTFLSREREVWVEGRKAMLVQTGMEEAKAFQKATREFNVLRGIQRGEFGSFSTSLGSTGFHYGADKLSRMGTSAADRLGTLGNQVKRGVQNTYETASILAQALNPIHGAQAIHEASVKTQAALRAMMNETDVELGTLRALQNRLQWLKRAERLSSMYDFLKRDPSSREMRSKFMAELNALLYSAKQKQQDLISKQSLRRAMAYAGSSLEDISALSKAVLRYADAEAELLSRSAWNPTNWPAQLRARQERRVAARELFQENLKVRTSAYQESRLHKYLNSRRRSNLDPKYLQDSHVHPAAEYLAEVDAKVYGLKREIHFEGTQALYGGRIDRKHLRHLGDQLGEALEEQRIARAEFNAGRRIEHNTQKYHRYLGGGDDYLESARRFATAKEAYDHTRVYEFELHLRDGRDPMAFDHKGFELNYEKARYEYQVALLRSKYDEYKVIREKAHELLEDADAYIARLSNGEDVPSPWSLWLERRRATREIRSMGRTIDFERKLNRSLEKNPFFIGRPNEDVAMGVVGAKLDPAEVLAEIKADVARRREQFILQKTAEASGVKSDIASALDNGVVASSASSASDAASSTGEAAEALEGVADFDLPELSTRQLMELDQLAAERRDLQVLLDSMLAKQSADDTSRSVRELLEEEIEKLKAKLDDLDLRERHVLKGDRDIQAVAQRHSGEEAGSDDFTGFDDEVDDLDFNDGGLEGEEGSWGEEISGWDGETNHDGWLDGEVPDDFDDGLDGDDFFGGGDSYDDDFPPSFGGGGGSAPSRSSQPSGSGGSGTATLERRAATKQVVTDDTFGEIIEDATGPKAHLREEPVATLARPTPVEEVESLVTTPQEAIGNSRENAFAEIFSDAEVSTNQPVASLLDEQIAAGQGVSKVRGASAAPEIAPLDAPEIVHEVHPEIEPYLQRHIVEQENYRAVSTGNPLEGLEPKMYRARARSEEQAGNATPFAQVTPHFIPEEINSFARSRTGESEFGLGRGRRFRRPHDGPPGSRKSEMSEFLRKNDPEFLTYRPYFRPYVGVGVKDIPHRKKLVRELVDFFAHSVEEWTEAIY